MTTLLAHINAMPTDEYLQFKTTFWNNNYIRMAAAKSEKATALAAAKSEKATALAAAKSEKATALAAAKSEKAAAKAAAKSEKAAAMAAKKSAKAAKKSAKCELCDSGICDGDADCCEADGCKIEVMCKRCRNWDEDVGQMFCPRHASALREKLDP
jgi:hypothetical protein